MLFRLMVQGRSVLGESGQWKSQSRQPATTPTLTCVKKGHFTEYYYWTYSLATVVCLVLLYQPFFLLLLSSCAAGSKDPLIGIYYSRQDSAGEFKGCSCETIDSISHARKHVVLQDAGRLVDGSWCIRKRWTTNRRRRDQEHTGRCSHSGREIICGS